MKAGRGKVRLGDIADVQSGGTPLISNKQLWNGGIAWYSSGELNSTFTTASERTVSAVGLEKSNAKLFPAGSLLIGMYDTAAMKMSILDRAAAFNQAIAGVKPNDQIDIRFVFYALNSIKEVLLGQRRGVRQKNLSLGKVRDFEIPFRSLEEQKRIVTLLDEAFAHIATAKANAEQNLQNARALFDSHLQSVLSVRGENWVEKRIEEWCTSIIDCVNKTAPVVDGPTPFKMIRTTNIRNGLVNVSSVRYVTEETYKVWTRRQVPEKGDVILTREAPMGEVGMLLSGDKIFLGQRLVSYRANANLLNNNFLLLALQSGDLQGQIHAKASGSTVQHMRVPDTKNLLLSAPPLHQQLAVVNELERLRLATQRLESIYQQKLTALNALKKSLLHQAFSAQL